MHVLREILRLKLGLGRSHREVAAAVRVSIGKVSDVFAQARGHGLDAAAVEAMTDAELEARLVTLFASCKTKLLGIPSRARQADPTLSSVQVAIVESLVREALEDLAEGKLEVDAA